MLSLCALKRRQCLWKWTSNECATNEAREDADDRPGVVCHEGSPDRRTCALERSRLLVAKLVGDLEQKGLAPDGVGGKGTLVKVGTYIYLPAVIVLLGPGEILLAVSTRVVLITLADAVALL